MEGRQNGYYRPYTSDDDDGTDSGSDTGSEDSISRGLDDPRYAIIRASGPAFETIDEQMYYQTANANLGYAYNDSTWKPPSNPTSHDRTFGPASAASQAAQVSLFSFNSANRETRTYPYSTFFTIKTPRTYKNITQIKFVNINFPYFLNSIADASSLYIDIANYVSSNSNNKFSFADCYACLGNVGNRGVVTSMNGGSFTEVGRVNPAAPTKELVHTFTMTPGSYDGPGYAAEMDKQMNLTPPFTIISYGSHRQIFMATKSVDHLFNEGGKWYYNITNKTYIQSPTKAQILTDHFPHIMLADPSMPSERETFVAYFFPILKQALNTEYDYAFLDLSGTSLTEAKRRVLQTYEGLSSDYYYTLCYANLQLLRSIRPIHTFEYYPINMYDWTYSPATQKITSTHTNLHPALSKDIQARNVQYQRQEAAALGYTAAQFGTIQSKSVTISAITTDLQQRVQKALATVGGIAAYSAAQLANPAMPLETRAQQDTSEEALFALTEEPRITPHSSDSILIQHLLDNPEENCLLNQECQMSRAGSVSNPAFQGVSVNCKDFTSLYSTFINYYSTSTGLANDIRTVHQNTACAMSNYVTTTYSRALPKSMLQDNVYMNNLGTGGLKMYTNKTIHYASSPGEVDGRDISLERIYNNTTTACCAFVNAALFNFYSCLPSEYLINSPFYKLGFDVNQATILNFYSTNALSVSPATYNIYLQLNTEQALNFMDIANDENYTQSNESTGQCNMVFGKLLTLGSSPGAYTQTIVQVPATFSPSPLASLDRFSFTFYLDNMVPLYRLFPFQLSGTDWDAIIEIDENIALLPPLAS